MVPSAGLEPAWVTPYAPQTYVSTNSTTTARASLFRGRSRGSRLRRGGGRRLRGRGLTGGAGLRREHSLGVDLLRNAADDGGLRPRLQDGQEQRQQDEPDECAGRQLVQERRRSPRAEGGLGASAAEGSGDVRPL